MSSGKSQPFFLRLNELTHCGNRNDKSYTTNVAVDNLGSVGTRSSTVVKLVKYINACGWINIGLTNDIISNSKYALRKQVTPVRKKELIDNTYFQSVNILLN